MRCINCGYTNTPTALRCDRCNSALDGSMTANVAAPPVDPPAVDPSRTMKGQDASSPSWDAPSTGEWQQAAPVVQAPVASDAPVRKPVGVGQRTIDPSRQAVASAVALRLVRMPREGEVEENLNLPGASVTLDRENADPGNMTISGKGQALLEFDNGSWYITDASALRTTYVRVAQRTRLNAGDVILLGDRAFRLE